VRRLGVRRSGTAVVTVLAAAVVSAVLALAFAGAASAHVTVSASDAVAGQTAVLTFTVPTESDTASTTKLAVQFPSASPIASVLVQPTPGWTAKAITAKLATPVKNDDGDSVTEAVTEIDWTADSAATAIKPGEFEQFVVQAGPMPSAPTLSFATLQTYSDGSVVKWIESPAPGSTSEPEHPAPVLTLSAGPAPSLAPAVATKSSSSDTGAVVLAVIALVVAAGAFGLAFVARAKRAAP
jgi:uncharacterized protein YcnI